MAFLKFNKSELVNLAYSLKREIIIANETGAYCNTSIVNCNTRKYHGLLAVTLDRFGGDKYLLLSGIDESLIVSGQQFNLGIHCYGEKYEPRGHKYVVDFGADGIPQITYKVGEMVIRKSFLLCKKKDQLMIRYELVESPSEVQLQFKPLLAFRNIHDLTHRNPDANTEYIDVANGVAFRLYNFFPNLNIQTSIPSIFCSDPVWNMNITYSDEYRRGYDCKEDLMMPGTLTVNLKKGKSVIVSASLQEEDPEMLEKAFKAGVKEVGTVEGYHEQLVRCADFLITRHNNRAKVNAGLSWLYTGLLRETLLALPGLALYGLKDESLFEEVLNNLVGDEKERLLHKTTQVEAPLLIVPALQKYIAYGADPRRVWHMYSSAVKAIIESYLPGERAEVSMQPNGLLWAQMDGVALSWMNAYVNGRAVTERAGYQVETNALWYNALCFALDMEEKFGPKNGSFVAKWTGIAHLVGESFQNVFWDQEAGYLADYVDNAGRHMEVRPNQMLAISLDYSAVPEENFPSILRVIDRELVTARGIRSLSPRDPMYRGVYEGSQIDRDLAYHQGCSFPFLLESYVRISFNVKGAAFWKRAQWLTEGFADDMNKHGVGTFSELYDGDPPHEPHGAISSALSTSALLAVDRMLKIYKED